ncbi:MAG: hypothetical protein A2504_07690 [Bdellovibrionales bacterium RIFOXYD12_FULL_39_22]|nr:MAG: hypothetical protein A2385_11015 [Bdellovibrionales bacterium RIFOXYB1_FULL_39_21]OFZ41288.1 MAG: hypothetical protein A2485_00670 [Bdellovibrionales bacterium RIFOXYC12_FULL_39_17]OFZ45062.1 MAG: hypothetical protein A2404_11310 [Bdellovibrionales bacterium RIFOXYC1_FULL_39_130]OFZ74446.1 MAG: hypothetical protein A2560_11345 [Bdellovibrionales bacterium RIFOXYD1_FULL_39_84]OFZ92458.1 MAG: hypothetical protein A2504_07690 [Bdellovibrionales bacterium RIFOXYD12_FULL_39_22]HLE12480.1 hy
MGNNYRIVEVTNQKLLNQWIQFPYDFYLKELKDPNYIPQIKIDEKSFFDAKKNPAFKIAKVKFFLAYAEQIVVGRICAIIHLLEEKKLGRRRGRFGWIEFIDNEEISSLLLGAARSWLVAEGAIEMTGPHGFTDLDPEGLLIDGFNELPTVSGSYNLPYYQRHFEKFGLVKDADYVEYRVNFPANDPFLEKMVALLERDSEYKLITLRNRKELMSRTDALWDLLEESFKHLYGVTPLSLEQQKFYTQKYLSFLDLEFVKMVEDKKGKLIGFFIGMPNVSNSFKRAGGNLLPFGLFHILREFKNSKGVDFLLAGVHPEHPKKKIFLYLVAAMYRSCRDRGIKFLETNRELVENKTVSGMWTRFDSRLHRKTRIFKLPLE